MTQTQDRDVLAEVREVVSHADASKAFGTPVVQDGTILLPVAKVGGGGGGGGGTAPAEAGHNAGGTGGGFGLSAKALGVYVLRDGDVRWVPAVDVNRIVLGGQVIVVAALLLARAIVRSRSVASHGRPAPFGRRGPVRLPAVRKTRRSGRH
jgi:uncharacterized spore protein YtfJ